VAISYLYNSEVVEADHQTCHVVVNNHAAAVAEVVVEMILLDHKNRRGLVVEAQEEIDMDY
jgi:hypothetical protein